MLRGTKVCEGCAGMGWEGLRWGEGESGKMVIMLVLGVRNNVGMRSSWRLVALMDKRSHQHSFVL